MNPRAFPSFVMTVLVVTFISLVSHAQESSSKKPNLFTNPSFAEGTQGWTVNADPGCLVEVDKTEMRDGKPSLKIFNAKGGDTKVTQKVTLKPDTRYRITAYIKTKDVIPDNRASKSGASIAILGGFQTSEPPIQKTKPWAKVELEFESGGKTEMAIGPRIGQYHNTVAGTAWFTDIVFVELGRSRK